MKKPNNITISLPQRYLEKLETLAQEEESIGQCAKRLLLSVLDESLHGLEPIENSPQIQNLVERLEALETQIKSDRKMTCSIA